MKANNTHDISVLDASGNEIGLILARDKNKVPIYSELTDPPLAQQLFMDEPDYARMPPEKEYRIVKTDFREGMGLEYEDSYTPKKYYYGINLDHRTRETGKLAPRCVIAPRPTLTSVSITNGDMELNSDWTNGAWSAAQVHGGTHSWGVGMGITAYQDLTWTTEYQGRTFKLEGWAYATVVVTSKNIGIDDGVGVTYASDNSAINGWEKQTVIRTLDANATRLRIVLRDAGAAGTVYFDDVSLTVPTGGAINSWAEYAGGLYAGYGNVLMRLNEQGSSFDYAYNFPSNITHLYPVTLSGVDYLFACLGWENAYWYIGSLLLDNCDTAWSELVDPDVTITLDTTDKQTGDASILFTVGANCAAGDILGTTSMSSTDLSSYTAITMWVKSSVATSAGDLQFLLDDTAQCASPTETIDFPALSANTATRVKLLLANPANDDATISMGIKMAVDKGAFTLNVDNIRAESRTQSNLANNYAKYFLEVGGTCYEADANYTLRTTTDPLNGGVAWSDPATAVGRSADDITSLLAAGGTPYIIKQDGLYYINSAGTVVLLSDYRTIKTSISGANSIIWNDGIYIPCGTNSLLEYRDDTLDWKSPHLYSSNLSAFEGTIRALAGDDDWLYAILDNGSSTEIIVGRYEEIEGVTDFRWHTFIELTSHDCNSAIVSSAYAKRLWLGQSSVASVYFVDFPKYQTGGYFITPWMHIGLRGDKKAFTRLTVNMADTTNDIYWKAYYQKFGDSSWTEINSTDKFKTSPSTTAYLPDDSGGNKPSSEYLRLKFEGITNDNTTTPSFLGYDLRSIWYPTYRKIIQCSVLVANNLPLKSGHGRTDDQRASTIRTTLDGLRNPTTSFPRGFYPPYAASASDLIYVKALPPSPEFIYRWNEKDQNAEWVCNLTLLVVPLS